MVIWFSFMKYLFDASKGLRSPVSFMWKQAGEICRVMVTLFRHPSVIKLAESSLLSNSFVSSSSAFQNYKSVFSQVEFLGLKLRSLN